VAGKEAGVCHRHFFLGIVVSGLVGLPAAARGPSGASAGGSSKVATIAYEDHGVSTRATN
jgi:hypothetical protein